MPKVGSFIKPIGQARAFAHCKSQIHLEVSIKSHRVETMFPSCSQLQCCTSTREVWVDSHSGYRISHTLIFSIFAWDNRKRGCSLPQPIYRIFHIFKFEVILSPPELISTLEKMEFPARTLVIFL